MLNATKCLMMNEDAAVFIMDFVVRHRLHNSYNIFPLNVKTKAIFSVQIKYIPLYNISFAAYMSRCQTVLCTGRCSAASFGSANSAFGSHVFNKRCFLTPNVLHSVESKWLQWHHLHLAFLSILVQFRVAISEFVC